MFSDRILQAQEEILAGGLRLKEPDDDLTADEDAQRKESPVFHHETENLAVYATDISPQTAGDEEHSFFVATSLEHVASLNHTSHPVGNDEFKSRAVKGDICATPLNKSMAAMAICLPPGLSRLRKGEKHIRLFFAAYYETSLFADTALFLNGSSSKTLFLHSSVIAASVGDRQTNNLSEPVQILFPPVPVRDEEAECVCVCMCVLDILARSQKCTLCRQVLQPTHPTQNQLWFWGKLTFLAYSNLLSSEKRKMLCASISLQW